MKRLYLPMLTALALILSVASSSPHKKGERDATAGSRNASTSPVSMQSNQPSPKPTTATVNNYTYAYYYPVPVSPSPPVWFQVFTTIVLLGFSGGLWWTSIQQWRALEEQAGVAEKAVKAAEESAKAAELALHTDRPFLLITKMRMEPPDNPTGRFYVVWLTVRNFGVGPADVRDYIADVELIAWPKPSLNNPNSDPPVWHPPDEGEKPSEPLICGGETVERIRGSVVLDPNDFDAMERAEKKVRVEGRIRYRGAAKREYITKFYWWWGYDPPNCPDGYFVRSFNEGANDYT